LLQKGYAKETFAERKLYPMLAKCLTTVNFAKNRKKMITANKNSKKKQTISQTKKVILEKYFGKAPVFGDGLQYQKKLRSK
jgi:hypothetical protein